MRAPEYTGISVGAFVLRVCAVLSVGAGCVLIGLAMGTIVKLAETTPEALSQVIYGVCLFGYAALLNLAASVSGAIRDIARNSFR